MDFLGIVILIVVFFLQLLTRKTRSSFYDGGSFGLLIFAAAIILIFGRAIYQSWQQYILWENDDLGRLFLPPYRDFGYFIFYARTRFFNLYAIALFFGFLFLAAAKYFNKKYQNRFFESIEPYLLASSLFIVGHPGWIMYLALLFFIYFLLHLFIMVKNRVKPKENLRVNSRQYPRLSAYYLWCPVAILTIMISKWLSLLSWWQIFKV